MFALIAQILPELSIPLWDQHRLAEPLWLVALLVLPLVGWLRRRRPVAVWVIPGASAWASPRSPAFSRLPATLAYLAAIFIVVALARPQRIDDTRVIRGEGYDLVIAIDLSTSMFAEDSVIDGARVNRLEALKPVIDAFVRSRPADRIGFVVFSGKAYTMAPLTHDHAWLARQIARLRIGLLEDGTAVGDALGLALTRLEQTGAEAGPRAGAFVILMTDGSNNKGRLAPAQAAALAASKKIPVYTIGVGRDGIVPFPIFDDTGRRTGTGRARSDLDEASLRDIARVTGGRYARADEPDAATAAFDAIDRAQKVSFDQRQQVLATELFAWPATAAAALLLLTVFARLRRP